MADLKISALTAATTPLGGTEVFPIVQSSTTVKASIANVQAAPVAAGTANGVQYLNGSKVPSTGTALSFDGTYALGIGTTLSAWGGNYRGLQAGSTAFFGGNTAGNRNYSSSNVYRDGTNYKYITTSFATQLEQSDGAFYWLQAASGTAGNAITFATGMTLDTSSNLTVTGNVVMGTSGKGIDFSVTSHPAGMTSELLSDYEEGTWTPSQGSGLAVVGAFSSTGKYTKIGRQVTIQAALSAATSISFSAAAIITNNLPFTTVGAFTGVVSNAALTSSTGVICSSLEVYSLGAIAATTKIEFSITYFV
jgi:hypothetical protein